jgi:hypothetical protein
VSESGIPPGYGPCYENPGPIYVDVGEGDEVEMVTVEEAERRGLGESIDMFKAMNDPVRDAAERVLNLHPSRRDSLWEEQTQTVARAYLDALAAPSPLDEACRLLEEALSDHVGDLTVGQEAYKRRVHAFLSKHGKGGE